VVSPIGAQGFVLGRGNQQFSPAVVKRVGADNIMVVATPAKLDVRNAIQAVEKSGRRTVLMLVKSGDATKYITLPVSRG
jgi:predicted polyphosphate/ATP-dependent NAD kinase